MTRQMREKTRILLICNSKSIFIKRLLQNILLCDNGRLEIELYDRNIINEQKNQEKREPVVYPYKVHTVDIPLIIKPLLKVPKIRFLVKSYYRYKTFVKLVKTNGYDIVNIQELPPYTLYYVKTTHKYKIKSILTPIGSDALRIEGIRKHLLGKAFKKTDLVTITVNSGFAKKVIEKFNIEPEKIRNLSYGSDAISEICRMRGSYSKQELAKILKIPYAEYYICCGYNAHIAQNHATIIEALFANVQYLPTSYKILIPLGYGEKDKIRRELEEKNKELKLDIVFLMDFLSPTEVAALRIITDLFIHIQDTDAHSFTMREFLLADTQVINGKWLSYPELEQYGVPYHVCEDKDSLNNLVGNVLTGQVPTIDCPSQLKAYLRDSSWEKIAPHWIDLYMGNNGN